MRVQQVGCMGKQQFVQDLEDGKTVDSLFAVTYKESVHGYAKGFTFSLELADKTGSVACKYWGGENRSAVERVYNQIEQGGVLRVQGVAGSFRGQLQVNVEEGDGLLKKVGGFDIEDFVAAAHRDREDMLQELEQVIESFENSDLQDLLQRVLQDDKIRGGLLEAPASLRYHHAYIGGLLEHILHLVNIAESVVENHAELDRDLLLTGCILQDMGKINT